MTVLQHLKRRVYLSTDSYLPDDLSFLLIPDKLLPPSILFLHELLSEDKIQSVISHHIWDKKEAALYCTKSVNLKIPSNSLALSKSINQLNLKAFKFSLQRKCQFILGFCFFCLFCLLLTLPPNDLSVH